MILKNLKHYFFRFLPKSKKFVASIFIQSIILFRPLLGPSGICPFDQGCTEFAIEQLEQQSFFKAVVQIIKRLLLCNPIGLFYLKRKNRSF